MPSHEYLVQWEQPATEQLDKIIAYLCGRIGANQFFANNIFALKDLRTVLGLASEGITYNFDLELLESANQARESGYSIEVDDREMFTTRVVDWDGLKTAEVAPMDTNSTIEYLKSARSEIAWLKNEIGRLRAHMENAVIVKEDGSRTSFWFHPSVRNG